jgi:hypothetical protein
LPTGDPIEDDFGPAVDQLPSVAAGSYESTASQISVLECREMGKDDQVNGYDSDVDDIHEKENTAYGNLSRKKHSYEVPITNYTINTSPARNKQLVNYQIVVYY